MKGAGDRNLVGVSRVVNTPQHAIDVATAQAAYQQIVKACGFEGAGMRRRGSPGVTPHMKYLATCRHILKDICRDLSRQAWATMTPGQRAFVRKCLARTYDAIEARVIKNEGGSGATRGPQDHPLKPPVRKQEDFDVE